MKRRDFLFAGALGAIAPASVFAQGRPVKIGMLGPSPLKQSIYAPGIVRRLAELGYQDVEYRSAEGSVDLYVKQARELIDLKCDLIFAVGTEAPARALQDARSPAPMVFLAVSYDPVDKGIVSNLRRPDRNTTGVYVPQDALVAKRVEIMREVLPSARRFLVFADVFSQDQIGAARKAAERVRFQLTVTEFSKRPYDYAGAFDAGRKAKAEAFMALASPVFAVERAALAGLLVKYRLPSVGTSVAQADEGFLLGFSANVAKVSQRVAELGVRILKGAKPADIPVEQADEFELAVNAKTAKALGIKIPESVFARATRIVT